MHKNDDWLGELMHQYALRLDRDIERDEAQWRDRVPESLDKRITALAAGILPAESALERLAPRHTGAGKRAASAVKTGTALRTIAIAAASAAVISVGAFTVSPTVRERVDAWFDICAVQARRAAAPGEYIIPSPGERYTVTDEAQSARMHGCWFTSEEREVLVQIAQSLPDGAEVSDDAEAVVVGGCAGLIEENGDTQVLILDDGGVMIRVELWGGDRDEIIDYAGRLLSANHRED